MGSRSCGALACRGVHESCFLFGTVVALGRPGRAQPNLDLQYAPLYTLVIGDVGTLNGAVRRFFLACLLRIGASEWMASPSTAEHRRAFVVEIEP